MSVPPLVALQAAGKASKSLTGDILTRTTSKVVGKGKKAQVVDTTAHINPLTIGVGLAATAVGVGLAAWILQLKLSPTRVNTYKTVVDSPAVPERKVIDEAAWVELIPHDAVGHWSHETIKVGTQTQWIGDTWIRGVLKPGHWITTNKVQDTGEDIWVVDIPAYNEKVFHPELSHIEPAIAAVTHQEPTGKVVKRFSIEQRQGFSISDLLPNPIDMVGAGRQAAADTLVPSYLKWAAPWTWGTKGKWL
jgi:hypothetical protein